MKKLIAILLVGFLFLLIGYDVGASPNLKQENNINIELNVPGVQAQIIDVNAVDYPAQIAVNYYIYTIEQKSNNYNNPITVRLYSYTDLFNNNYESPDVRQITLLDLSINRFVYNSFKFIYNNIKTVNSNINPKECPELYWCN